MGFFLNGTGKAAGRSVLAVRLPDAERNSAGAQVKGVGWGRHHGGTCVKCKLPAGIYELDLLTFDGSKGPATVTLRTSSASTAPLALRARDGMRSDVVQRGRDAREFPSFERLTPMWPYAGGMSEVGVVAGTLVPAVVIDQITLDVAAREGATVAGVVEMCRMYAATECERQQFVEGTANIGGSRVTSVEASTAEEEVARIGWDLAGQPDTWRARTSLLWVDLNPGQPAWEPAGATVR